MTIVIDAMAKSIEHKIPSKCEHVNTDDPRHTYLIRKT